MKARIAALATAAASLLLVAAGLSLIYPPLGLIVIGLGIGASLFIDVSPPKKGTP